MPIVGVIDAGYSRLTGPETGPSGTDAARKPDMRTLLSRACPVAEPSMTFGAPPCSGRTSGADLVEFCDLSPRQAQIVGLVMQSRQDKEIIAALDSSPTRRSAPTSTRPRRGSKPRIVSGSPTGFSGCSGSPSNRSNTRGLTASPAKNRHNAR